MKRLATRFTKTVVVCILAAGVGFGGAPSSFAAGKSGSVNNCYTQWWNTALAQSCDSPGASDAGWRLE